MLTPEQITQLKPLQRKAYKRMRSIIERRVKSEHQYLYHKYLWQRQAWRDELILYKNLNPFDDQHAQKTERSVYLKSLIEYGDDIFRELGYKP